MGVKEHWKRRQYGRSKRRQRIAQWCSVVYHNNKKFYYPVLKTGKIATHTKVLKTIFFRSIAVYYYCTWKHNLLYFVFQSLSHILLGSCVSCILFEHNYIVFVGVCLLLFMLRVDNIYIWYCAACLLRFVSGEWHANLTSTEFHSCEYKKNRLSTRTSNRVRYV